MNKDEVIDDLEREIDTLNKKVRDLEYENAVKDVKEEALWNGINKKEMNDGIN